MAAQISSSLNFFIVSGVDRITRFRLPRAAAMRCGLISRAFAEDDSNRTFELPGVEPGSIMKVGWYFTTQDVSNLDGKPRELLNVFLAAKVLDNPELERSIRERCAMVDPLTERKNSGIVLPHRHGSVFIPMGWKDRLCTATHMRRHFFEGERRITVQDCVYRIWLPESKLCAALLGGMDCPWMCPGTRVLYLGAGNGRSISYVSDILGEQGHIYAVEGKKKWHKTLIDGALLAGNVSLIRGNVLHPVHYGNLVTFGISLRDLVDVMISDVDVGEDDEGRLWSENARLFLKRNGHLILFLKGHLTDERKDAMHRAGLEILGTWPCGPVTTVVTARYVP